MSALQTYMADNQGSLDSLTTNGAMAGYSPGASSGFGAYIGKLSQHTSINVRGDSSGNNELRAGNMSDIAAHPAWINTIFVSIGNACVSGSSGYGTSTATDASVYTLLSNGTVYCASM